MVWTWARHQTGKNFHMCSQNLGCVCSMGDDQWICVEWNGWEIGWMDKWLKQKQTSTFWPLHIWKRTNNHLLEIAWSLCQSVVSRAGQDVPGPVSCGQGGTMKEGGSLVKIFYGSGVTNYCQGAKHLFSLKKKSCAQTQKHPMLLHITDGCFQLW